MRSTITRVGMLFGLVAGLFLGLLAYSAPAVAASGLAHESPVLNIRAGGKATIKVRGFCMDPGKLFPTGVNTPDGVADDAIRAGLNYAIDKGYDQKDPLQTQLAVWYLQTGNWEKPDHALADEIVAGAKDAANKVVDPNSTSLLDAMKDGRAKVTITFTPDPSVKPNEAYFGDGELIVENTSGKDLAFYLPNGAIFPPTNPSHQRLTSYVTQVVQADTVQEMPVSGNATGDLLLGTLLAFSLAVLTAGLLLRSRRLALR